MGLPDGHVWLGSRFANSGAVNVRAEGTLNHDKGIPGGLIGALPHGRLVFHDLGETRVRLYFSDGRVDESFTASHFGWGGGNAGWAFGAKLWWSKEPLLQGFPGVVNGAYVDASRGITDRFVLHLGKLPATALQLSADVPPQFGNKWFQFSEPPEGLNISFRVVFIRLGPSSAPATVHYSTRDVTATAGKDYVAQRGTITFFPLETEKTIQIAILADTEDEFTEAFEVVVTGAEGFEVLPAPMRLTILSHTNTPDGGHWRWMPRATSIDRIKRLGDGGVLLGGSQREHATDGSYHPVAVDYSANLTTWHPLTNLLGGFNGPEAVWLDATATNAATRFYRAVAR